jgi:hypothetical protein
VNFRRWVVFTFLVHVLVVAVDKGGGLVLYLLTADQPDQHGHAGIAASLPFILGAIANLGLATALVWLVRRGRWSAQTAFETSMAVALGWGGLVAIVAALVSLFVLPLMRADWATDPLLVVPICAAVPLLLVASYANSTQLATDRIRDYGVVHIVTSLAFLPAFFACFYWFGGRVADEHVPLGVAWGRLLSSALVVVVTLWLVRRVVKLRVQVHREFLGEALRFGWKANLTSTLVYLNHRIDLLVLGTVLIVTFVAQGVDKKAAEDLAFAQVAFYSMAVTWAELVWHFPEAMRDLFFSKVAGSTHEQARSMTPILSRFGLLLSIVGAAAILLLVDPVMGFITMLAKGSDRVWFDGWSPHVGAALLALAPGTVAYTVSKVLQADLAARDRLQTCVHAQLVVFVAMLALDFAWIPSHGALGAAWASSVAYVLGSAWTLVAWSRQTGIAAWRCVIVHPSDFRYIRDIVAAILGKLRRSRA